jgi:hypothetical protein
VANFGPIGYDTAQDLEQPAVFGRASFFLPWIKQILEANGTDGCQSQPTTTTTTTTTAAATSSSCPLPSAALCACGRVKTSSYDSKVGNLWPRVNPRPPNRARIAGGTATSPHQYPWLAQIHYSETPGIDFTNLNFGRKTEQISKIFSPKNLAKNWRFCSNYS